MLIHHIHVDRIVIKSVVDGTPKNNKLGGIT